MFGSEKREQKRELKEWEAAVKEAVRHEVYRDWMWEGEYGKYAIENGAVINVSADALLHKTSVFVSAVVTCDFMRPFSPHPSHEAAEAEIKENLRLAGGRIDARARAAMQRIAEQWLRKDALSLKVNMMQGSSWGY